MSDFRRLTDSFSASPQVEAGDVAEAARQGFAMLINNRPDDETGDQPSGAEIEAAATAAGMRYHAIPIDHSGFNEAQVEQMAAALAEASGPVLAYCRSGTRSTLLWSLARARAGGDPADIAQAAAAAGYDVSPVRPAMDRLTAQARR